MAKRTAASAPPPEGITDERAQELEHRMERLQETMATLIAAIDELREDLVHALRNLPDRLPPPMQVWSLPSDPTAPDFGDRINAVPLAVMEQLRDEAVVGTGLGRPHVTAEATRPAAEPVKQPAASPRPTTPAGGPQGRLF
jgi:hypothetical protein